MGCTHCIKAELAQRKRKASELEVQTSAFCYQPGLDLDEDQLQEQVRKTAMLEAGPY